MKKNISTLEDKNSSNLQSLDWSAVCKEIEIKNIIKNKLTFQTSNQTTR